MEEYRDAGYLSDAFVNYLSLLGWSPDGESTIIPRERLAREAIGDWCAELWDMSAPDHCVTCNHLGICGADMDPTRCYVAECLGELGVDLEKHGLSRAFVSQCEEEDE